MERLREAYQTCRILEGDFSEKWKPTRITKNPAATPLVEEEMEKIFEEEEAARKRAEQITPEFIAEQLEVIKKN